MSLVPAELASASGRGRLQGYTASWHHHTCPLRFGPAYLGVLCFGTSGRPGPRPREAFLRRSPEALLPVCYPCLCPVELLAPALDLWVLGPETAHFFMDLVCILFCVVVVLGWKPGPHVLGKPPPPSYTASPVSVAGLFVVPGREAYGLLCLRGDVACGLVSSCRHIVQPQIPQW